MKKRQLGDNGEARELISTLAALDHILLHDRTPAAINAVGVEKMSRKGFGIASAFSNVNKEADWKKPANGGKNWKSKVDYEIWKRIDPMAEDKDHHFINRRVEDEIRTEMERETQHLKARRKLQENQEH